MKRYTKSIQVMMLAAAGAVLAAGCGDTRSSEQRKSCPTRSTTITPVNQDCLFAKPMPFPYEVAMNDKLLAETRRRLDALSEAGLLEKEQNTSGRCHG